MKATRHESVYDVKHALRCFSVYAQALNLDLDACVLWSTPAGGDLS